MPSRGSPHTSPSAMDGPASKLGKSASGISVTEPAAMAHSSSPRLVRLYIIVILQVKGDNVIAAMSLINICTRVLFTFGFLLLHYLNNTPIF